MKKIFNSQRGYTFVELLIALIIIVTVGMIMVSILIFALRGSLKSNSVNLVRQEGNYALSQISKTIAYAKEFNGVSTDGDEYVDNCVANTSTINYVKVTSFDGAKDTFSCQTPPLSQLINSENVTVSSCSFTCTQSSEFAPPTIGIKFTLTKNTTGSFVENQSSVAFETSVTWRNY